MKQKYLTYVAGLCVISLIVLTVVYCFGSNDKKTTTRKQTTTTAAQEKLSGNSELAIIKGIDTDEEKITFVNIKETEEYILSYNGATNYNSKSGIAMAVDQFSMGDVVDITYESGVLTEMNISDEVWENTKVTSFKFDDTTHSVSVGQSLYSYSDDMVVVSDGKLISVMELNPSDQLTVRGYDKQVVSIVVDKGHGYISLSGDELFIGGYITIGSSMVRVIEEDMLLVATEGTYKVEVRNGSYLSSKNVTITRDNQSVVDFSDVIPVTVEDGNVRFVIDAEDAVLYIDGTETSYSSIVTLKSGKHTIKVTADGYDDYEETITVSATYQTVEIDMVSEDSTDTDETTTASEEETTTLEGDTVVSTINDVTISGPEGAKVYFDAVYKGVAPCTFDMITGTHIITILNDTQIKSYTVTLVEGADDVKYDFSNDFSE